MQNRVSCLQNEFVLALSNEAYAHSYLMLMVHVIRHKSLTYTAL